MEVGSVIILPQKDDMEALRHDLQNEIEEKTKICSNASFSCSLPRLEGHLYCLRHILQDPNAPYRQCTYNYPVSGRRCQQAAHKYDMKKNKHFTLFCFEHSRLAQLNKTRATIGKLHKPQEPEAFLNTLTHYVKTVGESQEEDTTPINLDPTTEIDVETVNERGRKILDYVSDSSSDEDPPTMGNTWSGHDIDNSDCESLDSENEDPLKHAGIYTAEEVARITKEKLIRLHSLYIDQFHRLGHVLREKRRKYLHALRKEREVNCNIHSQAKDSQEERHLYDKLKALNKYHKRHGVEAVLHRKYCEKRAKAFGGSSSSKVTPVYNRCTFQEGGVKCLERAIPCCKFCRRHILEDKKQVLFRACGVEKSGVVCQESVPMVFDDVTCLLHIEAPPPERSYALKKYESDPDEETDDDKGALEEVKQEGDEDGVVVKMEVDDEVVQMPLQTEQKEDQGKNTEEIENPDN